jgi:phosphatidate cytidylyltransferase
MKRLLTGLLLAAVLLPAIFLLPSPGILALVVVVVLLALNEYVGLARRLAPAGPYGALFALVPGLCALLILGPASPAQGIAVALAIMFLPWLCVLAARLPLDQAATAAGLMAIALPYFAAPAAAVYLLHRQDPWLVMLLAAIVVSNDALAFYLGRAFGRRKLAPRVSPKKTWEGAIGGLAGALLPALVWWLVRDDPAGAALVALAALTAVAAQLGDLAESALKRCVGVKDSGDSLPGHGGVLDRVDALLFAAPVFYLGNVLLAGWR